jgi:uncharacterized membrane-anchored protein YhcB (DUF1043 family)
MAENILIGVILWVVGLFFGFVIRGAFFKSSEAELKLRAKLDDTEKKWGAYQAKVERQVQSLSQTFKVIQEQCQTAESQVALLSQKSRLDEPFENLENPAPPKDYPSHS